MSDRHVQTVSLENTEVMWLGRMRKLLKRPRNGKKLKERYIFVYLGGAICEDGNSHTVIRIKEGQNGVMGDGYRVG